MVKIVSRILIIFLVFVALFVLQRLAFLWVYAPVIHADSAGDWFDVVAHGLPMDCSMAGYLTVIPAILTTVGVWIGSRILRAVETGYNILASFLVSTVFCLDIVLYSYWGFRLDMTPVFYFSTSPSAAMASAPMWMLVAGLVGVLALWAINWWIITLASRVSMVSVTKKVSTTAVGVLMTALLFLPIRGSLTVSTMNPSRAYFSQVTGLNHAAINPMFSLMYSATHQSGYADQYRFMSDEEADRLVARLEVNMTDSCGLDSCLASCAPLLKTHRPDIYIVILESFSTHLMASTGGADVARGLDSIAQAGVLFPNIYAGSFRTDRGIPAILSGLPGQPSTSVLKYIDKIEHLPSMPAKLKDAGYDLGYYYGGDINFTNMNAYLVNLGFDNIVSDKDFDLADKTSKWGAHDHLVFERLLSDIADYNGSSPLLRVIQTSSSHEPYQVPYTNPEFADNERLNAFAYTDSCLTAFVNTLSRSERWDSTLVIMVPDHWGVWPTDLEGMPERHHIPVVMAGGALANPGLRIERLGQQVDIAATLLAALDIDAGNDFPFSRNLMDATSGEYAFFSRPSTICLMTPSDTITIDCDALQVVNHMGSDSSTMHDASLAYLQKLYKYLSEL